MLSSALPLFSLSFFPRLSQTKAKFPFRATEMRCWRDEGCEDTHPAHTLSPSNLGDTGTRPSPGHRLPGHGRHSAGDSLHRTSQEDRLQRGGGTKPSDKSTGGWHRLNTSFPGYTLLSPWWSWRSCGRQNRVKMGPWLIRNYTDQWKTGLEHNRWRSELATTCQMTLTFSVHTYKKHFLVPTSFLSMQWSYWFPCFQHFFV